ncbi:MAG: DsbA family protein [Bdellovibrionota bacterium]
MNKRIYLSATLGTTAALLLGFIIAASCTNTQAKATKPNFVYKDAPRSGVVAKIGSEEISEEALIGADKLDFFELKKQEYTMKMERLNKMIVDKLIGAEAKKAGMSQEDFISKKVIGKEIKIPDAEYKKFVADKHIPETQINPQIKERINSYLQSMKRQELTQAYVGKLTKDAPVEIYFNKPKLQIPVEVGNAPVSGKADAPITVIEFSDFQCPFCARAADTVTELRKKYGEKVRVAFKHFPLPMHQEAKPVSEASMCVNEQSSDKFWKFHDLAFKNQSKLDTASLESYAKQSGADIAKYSECIKAKKYADLVSKDLEYGEKIGVKSTPTFFVNGQLVSGAVPMETFAEIIEDELGQRK